MRGELMAKKSKKDKEFYQVQDSVSVEISVTARVCLEDFDIYPEGMDIEQIKSILIKEFALMLEENESFEVGTYRAKVLNDTATSRSIPISKAEESS
jgi:hypothetical protein